jgi:superfamily II DNA or RNA helicase
MRGRKKRQAQQTPSWLPSYETVSRLPASERVDLIVNQAKEQMSRLFTAAVRKHQVSKADKQADTVNENVDEPLVDTFNKASQALVPLQDAQDSPLPPNAPDNVLTGASPAAHKVSKGHSSTAAIVRLLQVHADKFDTCNGERTWREEATTSLVKVLQGIELPSDKDYSVEVKLMAAQQLHATPPQESDSFDESPEGIDSDLNEDECLRLLSFSIANHGSAKTITIPVKARDPVQWATMMDEYEPLALTDLGFREYPLNRALTAPLVEPFRLELNQLRAVCWHARKVFHHVAETARHAALDSGRIRAPPQDWSAGGILADPPGTGKTIMAIAFALFNKKVGFFDHATFFFVSASVSQQYVNEIHRFVDRNAAITIADCTASEGSEKVLKQELKADKARWRADLFVLTPSRLILTGKKARDPLVPTHQSNLYGTLIFDDIHHMAAFNTQLFSRQFGVRRAYTIGVSATPIRDLASFLTVLAFCGNPGALLGDAAQAKMMMLSPEQHHITNKWLVDVVQPASERDQHLKNSKATQEKIELLLRDLASRSLPKRKDSQKAAMAKYQALMQEVFVPLLRETSDLDRYTEQAKRDHARYAKAIRMYTLPPGDKAAGPAILKRDRGMDAGVQHKVRTFVVFADPSSDGLDAIKKSKQTCVQALAQRILDKASSRTSRTSGSKTRLQAEAEAQRAYNGKDNFSYEVFHGALSATALAANKDLDAKQTDKLVKLAKSLLATVPSTKATIIADLIESMIDSWHGKHELVDERFASCIAPPPGPDDAPNKIVVFLRHAQIAALLLKHLQQRKIPFLNMFGGDRKNRPADSIDSWAESSIPILIISEVLQHGLNMTCANVVIFAEENYQETDDLQVVGRIDRIGQRKTCFVIHVRMRGSYDDQKRSLARQRHHNMLPLSGHSRLGSLLEIFDTSNLQEDLEEANEWAKGLYSDEHLPMTAWRKVAARLFGEEFAAQAPSVAAVEEPETESHANFSPAEEEEEGDELESDDESIILEAGTVIRAGDIETEVVEDDAAEAGLRVSPAPVQKGDGVEDDAAEAGPPASTAPVQEEDRVEDDAAEAGPPASTAPVQEDGVEDDAAEAGPPASTAPVQGDGVEDDAAEAGPPASPAQGGVEPVKGELQETMGSRPNAQERSLAEAAADCDAASLGCHPQ